MLESVDGVILAARDAGPVAATFESLFGTVTAGSTSSEALGAELTLLRCGTDLIRVAVPTGAGPIADVIDRRGEGIVGVVFAARDPDAVVDGITSRGVGITADGSGWLVDPARTHSLLTYVVASETRERTGAVSFIYEVTHLVEDWRAVSDLWTGLFGLDGAKFSPIKSDQYGYEGMLTLFDPPARLDRIEVVHPHDTSKAMGRFFLKRGEGPYMFFMETDDMTALRERLRASGARFAPEQEPEEPNSVFVHPSSTHGVLIGVSPRNLAWVWSGRPELARASKQD